MTIVIGTQIEPEPKVLLVTFCVVVFLVLKRGGVFDFFIVCGAGQRAFLRIISR